MKDYDVAMYVANGYSSNIHPDEIFEDLVKFGVDEEQYIRVHKVLDKKWAKDIEMTKEDFK